MKTTILFQDGDLQIVLQPETETDKAAIALLKSNLSTVNVDTVSADFRLSHGGYYRNYGERETDSLVITARQGT